LGKNEKAYYPKILFIIMKKAMIASLDPPWIAKEDLDYALLLIKASLMFFEYVIINDSELIDSNQMRYVLKNEGKIKNLVENGRIILLKRNDSIEDTLKDVLNRDVPMLFSSLDYTSNDVLLSMRKMGKIEPDKLYAEFNNHDLRTGLKNILLPYGDYIKMLDSLMKNSPKMEIKIDIFQEKIEFLKNYAEVPSQIKFKYRTDVYNYIEKISIEDPYRKGIIKNGLKALADLIYIFNKAYGIKDSEIFIVFDKRHYDEIESSLNGINLCVEDVKKLYKDKEIKIIKIKIYPMEIDKDVNFFIDNVLPSELIVEKKENLPEAVLRYLEEKGDYEKLSFLKFIKKREKYSRIIERRFPRLRSAIEILVLILTIIDISFEIIATKEITYISLAMLVISIIVSVDGILGFIEFGTSRKLNTNFYEKVISWYNDHRKRLEQLK
jgi:hypothetical protein